MNDSNRPFNLTSCTTLDTTNSLALILILHRLVSAPSRRSSNEHLFLISEHIAQNHLISRQALFGGLPAQHRRATRPRPFTEDCKVLEVRL